MHGPLKGRKHVFRQILSHQTPSHLPNRNVPQSETEDRRNCRTHLRNHTKLNHTGLHSRSRKSSFASTYNAAIAMSRGESVRQSEKDTDGACRIAQDANGKQNSSSSVADANTSPRLESGGPSKVSKALSSSWRAASHIGSVVDDWPMYSSQPTDYILGPAIGFGASSVVHQASFLPLGGRACAVKVIDLEAFGRDLAELRRETQLMSLSKHPNVLRVRGCWVQGAKLHIATRLMNAGSMLDIMRFSHPEGFDEIVIATVLKQALEGLNYLHINGWLHRDLKAANVLVDDDGTVLLGDFGVGVYLTETGKQAAVPASSDGNAVDESNQADRIDQAARKSFVGTPCWMAPEVVERKGYGAKADIWSLGITALELSSGRAPHSRLPPVKVLMHTLQDDPPTLDRKGGAHQYSKVFDDFVRQCLQKNPAKRPTAEKLLSHGFFKQARSKRHLVSAAIGHLPPLAERQERQRAMSIASLQNQTSWDFDSYPGSRLQTPAFENSDPFSNFSGVITSPKGSVRSTTKLISIDGEHAIVEDASVNVAERRDSWRGSMGGGAARRQRPPSGEYAAPPLAGSWNRRSRAQRMSVSFSVDPVEKVDEEEQETAPIDVSSKMHDNVKVQEIGTDVHTGDEETPKVPVVEVNEKEAATPSLLTETSAPSSASVTDETPSTTGSVQQTAQQPSPVLSPATGGPKHNKAIDRLGQLFKRH